MPGTQTLLSSLRNVPYEPVDPEAPDAQLIVRLYENGTGELIPTGSAEHAAQTGDVGCTKTTARRCASSLNTGSSAGSPR